MLRRHCTVTVTLRVVRHVLLVRQRSRCGRGLEQARGTHGGPVLLRHKDGKRHAAVLAQRAAAAHGSVHGRRNRGDSGHVDAEHSRRAVRAPCTVVVLLFAALVVTDPQRPHTAR